MQRHGPPYWRSKRVAPASKILLGFVNLLSDQVGLFASALLYQSP
jgi:hypothetical protein